MEQKEAKVRLGAAMRAPSTSLLHGFTVTARDLGKLHVHGDREGALRALQALDGVEGLALKLSTSLSRGTSGDPVDVEHRQEAYGPNTFPEPPFAGFWALFFESFQDPILLILIAAACVSFAVGLADHPDHGWIDGTAIVIAILLVAFVTATNNYRKELQFRALRNDADAMVRIRVIRNGEEVGLGVSEIVVGDVVHLETGDKIVADGVFINGSGVKTDEAALTGESDNVNKNAAKDPFLLSGTAMAAGTCNMLVTAVGVRSTQGKIMADTAMEAKDTPLQEKLEVMATRIGYFGFVFAGLTFIAMIVSWFADNSRLKEKYNTGSWIIHAIITSVTIVVVAIPEGLPLAVTISLAYSTRKMLKDNNLIRVLAACETMGNATDICSDKTGTLTENRMTVVQGWLGGDFVDFPSGGDFCRTPSNSPNFGSILDKEIAMALKDHLSVNSTVVVTWDSKGKPVIRGNKTESAGVLLVESMGFRVLEIRGGEVEAGAESTTPTPRATAGAGGGTGGSTSAAVRILRQYPFTAERKMMSTLVALDPSNPADGPVRLYVTGASEFVLKHSSTLLWPQRSAGRGSDAASRLLPNSPERSAFLNANVIEAMAKQSLRTLGLAYRDYGSRSELPANWGDAPADWKHGEPNVEQGLTMYGVLGVKDPLRGDVKQAVAYCQMAGIMVRMVTGDNVTTARAIAKECGIVKSDDDLVIEGPAFRKMTPAQVDAILPRLKVMARSSPRDKNLLVRRLNGTLPKNKEEWEKDHADEELVWDTPASLYVEGTGTESKAIDSVDTALIQDTTLPGYLSEWKAARKRPDGNIIAVVGVTGDGTNDAPALKAADVGLSMGITGTQVAKDASDIVILDDRFSSIVRAVMWGRSVYDNIRKFLQFQLTVNVVAVLLVFISAVSQRNPPLSPVQLLWVNLIMDTMGALALGTEEPTFELLKRRPFKQHASIIDRLMWRNILCQSAYQLAITLFLVYKGKQSFGIDLGYIDRMGFSTSFVDADPVEDYLGTFVFNTFVFSQVFNEFNARSIGNDTRVYHGLHKNGIFMAIIIITIGLQIFIVEVGGRFTSTTGLSIEHWGWSIVMGFGSAPVGFLMRSIPVTLDEASFANYYNVDTTDRSGDVAIHVSSSGRRSPRVEAVHDDE